MNRTYLVVLNLLLTSIYSIARPVDIVTPTSFDDVNYNIDDEALRIPDENDDVLPVLVRKDDLISTSNLNKIYTIEHKFATTRSLKDETENEGFKSADLKQVSLTAKSKSAKEIEDEPEERRDTTEEEEIKTRTDKRVESKSSERSSATATSGEEQSKTVKQEKRSGTAAKTVEETKTATQEESTTLEKSDTAAEVGQSKNTKQEESKTEEFTSALNELEKTTTSFRREVKDTDYLENEYEINDKVAAQQDSERKGYEMLINDESNSSWDLLDDLPASRRMISQPEHLNMEVKAKAGNEIVQPVEARNVLETKITSRNHISHDNMFGPPATPIIPIPQFRSTVSVPHIHSAIIPQRRFIVPGFIKVPPVVNINFRRLLNQEENNVLNRNNIQHEHVERYISNNVMNQNRNIVFNPKERSEVPPNLKDAVEDYKSEDLSNAYPYAPVDLYSPKTPQVSTVNPIVTKLIEASEHPQRSTPNINREYVQNFPNNPYSNNMSPDKNNYYANNGGNMQNYPSISYARPNNYAVPQNYGGFKYVRRGSY